MIFALAGNQNCGKTTLFNQLTGARQRVGNFPGVTIEKKTGEIKGQKNALVVDLPGIYSLSPYTGEEIVTRDFLIREQPDGIINIVDATNLERNLYLSLQLLEMEIPTVIALNMMDEFTTNGGMVDLEKMAKELGVPVVPISASRGDGVDELVRVAMETVHKKRKPKRTDFCAGAMHRCIHSLVHQIEDHAEQAGLPLRYAATKLIEGDASVQEELALSANELDLAQHSIQEMETELKTDRYAALADMRYQFIEHVCHAAVIKAHENKQALRSTRIDRLLTGKYTAIPIFLGIMLLIFFLTFDVLGNPLSDLLAGGIESLGGLVQQSMEAAGVNVVVQSFVVDGVFGGVGGVLGFLPIIVILFLFLSLLEDSGYMARIAFVMDKPLRKIGLSGKSFVPMLIGFGCSVPAFLSTRTLTSSRDKKMTLLLIPFMSCSAKLPVYALISAAFFPQHAAIVMMLLYVGGIGVGILCALIARKTVFRGTASPFLLELPSYRLPAIKNVMQLLWERARDFLQRAFTIIFLASIIIWLLQSFDLRWNMVDDASQSILANIGNAISPIFAPLGFGNWQASTALLTGFSAKEAVVSTFMVLTGANAATLPVALGQIFTPAAALSFLTFTLLYTPCVAAVAALKREWSGKATLGMIAFQLLIAWGVSFVVYTLAQLVMGGI